MNGRSVESEAGGMACLVMALFMGAGAPAYAQGPGEVEGSVEEGVGVSDEVFFAKVEQAQAAFSAREYERALELFEQAYQMRQDANLLFNIGFTHERLGNLESARAHYERFIDAPDVELGARRTASKRLRVIREILAEREASDASPEDQAEEPESRASSEASSGQAGTQQAEAVEPPPEPEPARGPDGLALGGMVTGGALVASGGVLWYLSSHTNAEIPEGSSPQARRALRQRALWQARVGDGLVAGGAVVGALGVVRWLGRRDARPEASNTLEVLPGAGRGVQVRWQF